MAKDSRLVICNICKVEVPRRGKTTKSFTTTNSVHHLKAKDVEDYTEYNKLKGLNKDKQQKESHSSKTLWFKQISLADTAKCHKVWDIN